MCKACVNGIGERKNIMSEDKKVVLCADCGCVIEAGDDRYTLGDRRIVCGDCISNYARCEECGEYVCESS